MNDTDFLRLIRRTYEDITRKFKSINGNVDFDELYQEIEFILLKTKNNSYSDILENILEKYLESIKAISKLSPGLSTGLHDYKKNITINTYNGLMSEISGDDLVTENTVFDSSSMTKMFTSILLLKEVEKENIDITKNFSFYSKLLKKLDIPIIDALRFGVNIKSRGRVDENGISKEERIKRLIKEYPEEKNTFIYNDMAYMVVPLLFGDTIEDATDNYLDKFYSLFRDELGLLKTGYSTVNMTGGKINEFLNKDNNKIIYTRNELFDPKANIFENEVGLVTGHAGITTTIEDIEKLYDALINGFLSAESLKKLVTTIQPNSLFLLDKNGEHVLKNNKKIIINRALGVYINLGNIRLSDLPDRYSKTAFAAAGSTGTYAVFDLENGFNASFFSNIKSGLYSKQINTENYIYGDSLDQLPKNYQTVLISGTGTMEDGKILRPDGTYMSYSRATNNFKEEQFETLLKLRIVKEILIRKAQIEYNNKELYKSIKEINSVFNMIIKINNNNVKVYKK